MNFAMNANFAGWSRGDVRIAFAAGQFQGEGTVDGELPVELAFNAGMRGAAG
jgi:hypothetical protein